MNSLNKLLIALLLTLIFILHSFSFPTKAHTVSFAFQQIYFAYTQSTVSIKYQLRFESLVIDNVYPQIDINNNGITEDDEWERFGKEVFLKNLEVRFNNKKLEFELLPIQQKLNKSEIRGIQDYFEWQFIALDPVIRETNSIYAKYDKLFLHDDPFGDTINFEDSILYDNNLEKIDDLSNPNTRELNKTFKFRNFDKAIQSSQTNLDNQIQEPPFWEIWNRDFVNFYNDLINQVKKIDYTNPYLIIIASIILFIAGALHTITPGHGKSVLAAFLIGKSESKVKDVFILASSITLSHTLVIYLLGFVLLFWKITDSTNQAILFIEKISAWIMVFLAFLMIYRGYESFRLEKLKKNLGIKKKNKLKISDKSSNYDLFIAGISGGLIPCIDALTILILFIGLGQTALGLYFVFIFSLGLALTIILIGLSLVYGKKKLNLESRFGNMANTYFPVFSGIVILIVAIIYLSK